MIIIRSFFFWQLEKAKESTDAANLRAAYATATVYALTNDADVSAGPVTMTQSDNKFDTDSLKNQTIGTQKLGGLTWGSSSPYSFYVNVSKTGAVTISATASYTTTINPTTGSTTSGN